MSSNRALCLASIHAALLISVPAAAGQWKIFKEEGVSLEYRNAADTELVVSVYCSSGGSQIVIPLPPGVKAPPQAPELRVREQEGNDFIRMRWDVCGGELTCTDRPDGEVSTYHVGDKGKQIALRFADRAVSLDIEAPGVSLSAATDRKILDSFGVLCRKQ